MRGRRASAEARTPLPQCIAAGAFVVPGACAGGVCRGRVQEVCAGKRVPAGRAGRCVPGGLPKRAEERDEPPAEGARGWGVPKICSAAGCGCKKRPTAPPVMPDLSDRSRRNNSGGAENLSCCGALWPCRRAARRDGLRMQGATGGTAGHAGSIAQAPAEHSGGAAGCRGLRKVSPATSPERIRAGPETRPSAPRRRRAGACRRPCRSARHAPACG